MNRRRKREESSLARVFICLSIYISLRDGLYTWSGIASGQSKSKSKSKRKRTDRRSSAFPRFPICVVALCLLAFRSVLFFCGAGSLLWPPHTLSFPFLPFTARYVPTCKLFTHLHRHTYSYAFPLFNSLMYTHTRAHAPVSRQTAAPAPPPHPHHPQAACYSSGCGRPGP